MELTAHTPVSVLVFAASMRRDSLNGRLAALAASVLERHGAVVDRASMSDFDCPSYNLDEEREDGIPAGAQELKRRIDACDAFVISSPEYNASMPGALKNVIDWTSRFRPQPFKRKHALLLSASPSMAGGNRGLWALRVPLEHLGVQVHPDMFSLAQAHEALTPDGTIANPKLQAWFEGNIQGFLALVEADKHYPCMKAAWIEFLGEQPDRETERVEPA